MKLLLRRDQKSGMIGGITFTLDVRAELSEAEKSNIRKYKMGGLVLYERDKLKADPGTATGRMGAILAYKMMNLTIKVSDLADGKQVECKDITEMLAVEEQIKEAARALKAVLEAAAQFGGEEVLEIA